MTASAGTGRAGNLGLGDGHARLFSRLQGRAHAAIKGMCREPEGVEAAQVSGRIARVAGRFTGIVTGKVASMCCTEDPERAEGKWVFDFGGMMAGLGGRPLRGVHGMPIRIDERIGSWVAFCVNRRNMTIGLGDGRLSYDREKKRLHMSVEFAFDVSRTARGVMFDFGRELDPDYRPGGAVRRSQLR